MDAPSVKRTDWWSGCAAVVLLAMAAGQLWWAARLDGLALQEAGYFANGLYRWYTGRNGAFRQNPPLGPLLAGWAGALEGVARDEVLSAPRASAVGIAVKAVQAYAEEHWRAVLRGVVRARLVLAIAYTLAGYALYEWLRRRIGAWRAVMVLVLWCFSPVLLTSGHLLMADAWAALIALGGVLTMGSYLERPTWRLASLTGLLLGLGITTKFTLLALLPVWLMLQSVPWLQATQRAGRLVAHSLLSLVLAWLVLGTAYRFEGVGTVPAVEAFESATLWRYIAPNTPDNMPPLWWRTLATLLPNDFLLGLETQALAFETEKAYMRVGGKWFTVGPPHYYVSQLVMKDPIGFAALWVLLLATAALVSLCGPYARRTTAWLPSALGGLALLLVVSTEGRYMAIRYAWPAYSSIVPLMGLVLHRSGPKTLCAVAALLVAGLIEALPHTPRFVGFCSVAIGGPGDPKGLADAKLTHRGQDLLRLRRWLLHEAPRHAITHVHLWVIEPLPAGALCDVRSARDQAPSVRVIRHDNLAPFPGWHVVDRLRLAYALAERQEWAAYGMREYLLGIGAFAELEPEFVVGDSLLVYRVTADDLARLQTP